MKHQIHKKLTQLFEKEWNAEMLAEELEKMFKKDFGQYMYGVTYTYVVVPPSFDTPEQTQVFKSIDRIDVHDDGSFSLIATNGTVVAKYPNTYSVKILSHWWNPNVKQTEDNENN